MKKYDQGTNQKWQACLVTTIIQPKYPWCPSALRCTVSPQLLVRVLPDQWVLRVSSTLKASVNIVDTHIGEKLAENYFPAKQNKQTKKTIPR